MNLEKIIENSLMKHTFFYTHLFFFTIFTNLMFSQCEDDLVKDHFLSNKLRSYIINHSEYFTRDSNGKVQNLDQGTLHILYDDASIISHDLKTDKIVCDKYINGIYDFRLANLTSNQKLYYMSNKKVKFIDIQKAKLNIDIFICDVLSFMQKNKYTNEEKIKTLAGILDILNLYK